jgi:two-component system, sensor histidine kinase and response regulator
VGLQTETETHHLIRFEIRDTGIGISEEDRQRLFERFTQLDADSSRRFSGVGLGLATARHLVEALHGIIDVESTPGEGSTFWFAIPFPKVSSEQRPIASSTFELKGMRVLVVEPHPTSMKVLRHYLERAWEMRLTEVTSGSDALGELHDSVSSDPYRILIYDGTGDVDALDLARAIRDDGSINGTAFIQLTVPAAEVDPTKARDAGIISCVRKPVGQQDLFEAIAVAVAHDALRLAHPGLPSPEVKSERRALRDEDRKAIRILIAEDNFLNMKLTSSQLQKLGFQAESVANGREALEAIAHGKYDVILMDCQMPIVDGYEATAEIRRREAGTGFHHHIIAMTANVLEGDREKCLAAGMDDYLGKPTRHEELEQALERYLIS